MQTLTRFRLFMFLASLLLASAASAGDLTQTMSLEQVKRLAITGDVVITLIQDDSATLEVTADEKVLQQAKIEVNRDTLVVDSDGGSGFFSWFKSHESGQLRLVARVPELENIRLSGAVHLSGEQFHAKKLDVDISGASTLTLVALDVEVLNASLSGASGWITDELSGDEIKAELSGASKFEVRKAGAMDVQKITLSGASHYLASPLSSTGVEVSASGASNIEVNAREDLKANLSGASNVHYRGRPRLSVDTSGASGIHSMDQD